MKPLTEYTNEFCEDETETLYYTEDELKNTL